MKKQVLTIGGNRLGSGEKMKTAINNYNRSTHNLSTKVATSMSPGALYPISVIPAMRGDSFEIDLSAECRTIPTKGALFGSYKLQVDVFQCPIRLYQAILHNNPQAIGLKMNQVLFPLVQINGLSPRDPEGEKSWEMESTSLMKYLGVSGIGTASTDEPYRDFNAIPILAYYDIYKTYYANKQEEKGYIIGTDQQEDQNSDISYCFFLQETEHHTNFAEHVEPVDGTCSFTTKSTATYSNLVNVDIYGYNLNDQITIFQGGTTKTIKEWKESGVVSYEINNDSTWITLNFFLPEMNSNVPFKVSNAQGVVTNTCQLKEFPLKNIDDMRYELLSQHELGVAYHINEFGDLPYSEIYERTNVTYQSLQNFPLAGLAIKTYQNDIYNNWLNTDWLEGENSISEITSVAITDGHFSMDSLNFAQKLYNMLNRIVLAGNTYEDWQDVVYEEVKRRQIESPIFCGGMSQEIMFDEVLQTTPTDQSALGTIGGRGRFAQNTFKGGKVHVKCDEASFIIVIASLTPRVFYTQGNEFWMTDLFSMDDFHKPALDGIGYQDLLGERMNWKNTLVYADGEITRGKAGKLPAWINYMTNVDRAYGDFAKGDLTYMILNRNYGSEDYTTYIDPAKYNYAFADASLTAQNFWLMFALKIEARRLMSARIIPNV